MFAEYVLPLLFVVMALIPAEPDPPEAPQVIDFFYSIFLMLVLGVVILGSFTFMTLGRTDYMEALTYTVFMIAGTVFIIGLAWNPHTGFAGLNVFSPDTSSRSACRSRSGSTFSPSCPGSSRVPSAFSRRALQALPGCRGLRAPAGVRPTTRANMDARRHFR